MPLDRPRRRKAVAEERVERPLPTDGERVLSVSELTAWVKGLLTEGIPSLWVRGEVSGLRRQSSGHVYFTLKDAGALVPAVAFKWVAQRCGKDLREGSQVRVFGRLDVYEPHGRYQFITEKVVDDGLGRLREAYLRLKEKLEGEGLFAPERKRPLPAMPQVVGIVTSPTGAALRDFLSILRRRHWRGRVVVLPAKVQGVGAAEEIAGQVSRAGQRGGFDLLVVGRGGGSVEDLWAFNEEVVVRAVAACPLPVISAVGHETDFLLSDFAADKRAETPSAAAELISSGYVELLERLRRARRGLSEATERPLERARARLERLATAMGGLHPQRRMENANLRVDDLGGRLKELMQGRLRDGREQLGELDRRLQRRHPERPLELGRERLRGLARRLESVAPERVLARGYVIVRDARGKVLTRREEAKPGKRVRLQFADGEVKARTDDRPEQAELFE